VTTCSSAGFLGFLMFSLLLRCKFPQMMAHTQQKAGIAREVVPDERRDVARHLARRGDDAAARAAYVQLLQVDPRDHDALVELGSLAAAGGYIAAARTVFAQAVQCYPESAVARVGLAQALIEGEDFSKAVAHCQIALRVQPGMPEAHRALARCLDAQGDRRAAAHRHLGYRAHAVVQPRTQMAGQLRVLLLVAARGGNISVQGWFDPAIGAVTAVYDADYLAPDALLPAHDLVGNAIGDADYAGAALAAATRQMGQFGAQAINRPDAVQGTGRETIARRLAALPGVVMPRLRSLSRGEAARISQFQVLLRTPGYHTGQHFERADDRRGLCQVLGRLPGARLLAIDYSETRGPDGFWRKYRVLIIDGVKSCSMKYTLSCL
jgi:Tfp pilus assembly protein PilF